jgi:rod shape-determining protein MreC
VETVRSHTVGFVQNYFVLMTANEENRRLKQDLDKLKLENQFLKTELSMADRVRALAAFQSHTQSRTLAARIIATGTGSNSKVVFIDRGSTSGVMRGMAVITPDGIVGRVLAAYPIASQVLLVTDASFAAGVLSQKNRVHGTIKGQGHSTCIVDYVQNEEKVDVGEWFYTSGDDRVFPKGVPAGVVTVVRAGKTFKEIYITPSGLQNGIEEVLVVLEGAHQVIPDAAQTASRQTYLMPPPAADPSTQPGTPQKTEGAGTEADRLKEKYKAIGTTQNHVYGEGSAPNFNSAPRPAPATAAPPQQPKPIAPPSQTTAPPAAAPAPPRNQ